MVHSSHSPVTQLEKLRPGEVASGDVVWRGPHSRPAEPRPASPWPRFKGALRGPAAALGAPWLLQVLRQRQEGEAAALHTVQKLRDERRLLQERLDSLQGALAQREAEKREVERSALRLEKDRVALKRMLDKVGCASGPSPPLLWVLALLSALCLQGLGASGAPGPWSCCFKAATPL